MIAHTPFTAEAPPPAGRTRVGPLCDWCDEVTAAVAPARSPGASIWERSRVVRELERVLVPRFREERARVAQLEELMDRRTRDRVWATGELLELLYASLVQDVQLPLRGAKFSAELEALLRALDRWCEEAEIATRHAERS
jgi:hypothetical protein